MSQMKTTWSHPAKKRALIWFSFFSFMLLLWIPFDLAYPETRTGKGYCYLLVFFVGAVFFGYRSFIHSDDWFRVREEKWSRWWSKHPRLEVVAGILIWTALIIYMFGKPVWQHLHKH
jgi:hypothetical protein